MEINPKTGLGQIKIGSEIWSAKADNVIPTGTQVEVTEISGVKVVVKALDLSVTK